MNLRLRERLTVASPVNGMIWTALVFLPVFGIVWFMDRPSLFLLAAVTAVPAVMVGVVVALVLAELDLASPVHDELPDGRR